MFIKYYDEITNNEIFRMHYTINRQIILESALHKLESDSI